MIRYLQRASFSIGLGLISILILLDPEEPSWAGYALLVLAVINLPMSKKTNDQAKARNLPR